MQGEDIQAGNSLRNLSQRTSYIMEWDLPRKADSKHPQSIPEEPLHQHHRPKHNRIEKETSEKYDLRKYEKKLEALKDAPVVASSVQLPRRGSLPPSPQRSPHQNHLLSAGIMSRKHSRSVNLIRQVEEDYVQRRVQAFQRKNTDSQKDLQSRLAGMRQKYLPLHVNAKLSQQEMKQHRMAVCEQEMEIIRRMIASKLSGTSLNSNRQQDRILPMIRALH